MASPSGTRRTNLVFGAIGVVVFADFHTCKHTMSWAIADLHSDFNCALGADTARTRLPPLQRCPTRRFGEPLPPLQLLCVQRSAWVSAPSDVKGLHDQTSSDVVCPRCLSAKDQGPSSVDHPLLPPGCWSQSQPIAPCCPELLSWFMVPACWYVVSVSELASWWGFSRS